MSVIIVSGLITSPGRVACVLSRDSQLLQSIFGELFVRRRKTVATAGDLMEDLLRSLWRVLGEF